MAVSWNIKVQVQGYKLNSVGFDIIQICNHVFLLESQTNWETILQYLGLYVSQYLEASSFFYMISNSYLFKSIVICIGFSWKS